MLDAENVHRDYGILNNNLGRDDVAYDHALSFYLCNLLFFPSRAKEAKKKKKPPDVRLG